MQEELKESLISRSTTCPASFPKAPAVVSFTSDPNKMSLDVSRPPDGPLIHKPTCSHNYTYTRTSLQPSVRYAHQTDATHWRLTMRANLSDIIFTTAWRSLSYQAIPIMFTEHDLDVDGLLPRALCPKVYDQVQKLVSDMGWDAQYAIWMWHEVREESGRLNWHPHFELPFGRRIVEIEEKEEKGLPTGAE
jgi:hypothetical protein